MSHDDKAANDGHGINTQAQADPQLRMRTPAIVLSAHAIVLVVSLQASTLMVNIAGVYLTPLVVGLVLLVWWLRSKQIPFKERIGLLALGFGVQMWAIALLRPTDPFAVILSMSVVITSCVLA